MGGHLGSFLRNRRNIEFIHQQHNKWYPKRCLLSHFEATLDTPIANLHAHNNLWLCYYGQVNSLRLKSSTCSFEMGK